jgi:protein-disulfide isomerase
MNDIRRGRTLSTSAALLINAAVVSSALIFLGIEVQLARHARPAAGARPAFNPQRLTTSLAGDYVYGSRDARVSLISFMDFECPYCATMYPAAKQLVDASGSGINLVIRVFPIEDHPHGEALAAAAVCIAEQKGATGFYLFVDRIFAHGAPIVSETPAFVAPIARDLGVDDGSLEQCMSSDAVKVRIRRSSDEGTAIGVSGTPATVVRDGLTGRARFVVGTRDVAQLKGVIATLND